MQLRETNAPEDEIALQRGRLIDAFVKADEFIQRLEQLGHPPGPADAGTAERLAIRLLVKRFGWRMTAPGTLQRVKR